MKLGFVSAILPDQSLEEVVSTAAEIGFDCVELMCWPRGVAERRYAGVTHVDVTDFSQEDATRLRRLVEAADVTISALGYYPNPLAPDAEEARVAADHIRKVILAAERADIPQVNTFIGRDSTRSVEENWPHPWTTIPRSCRDWVRWIGAASSPCSGTWATPVPFASR